MPTRSNRWFLLQILLLSQHVSGTIMPNTRSSRVLYRWLLPVVLGALVFKLSVRCEAEGYVSGLRAAALELLIMGEVVPETCWASNKICNKNHLLHLVGILFPHTNRITLSLRRYCSPENFSNQFNIVLQCISTEHVNEAKNAAFQIVSYSLIVNFFIVSSPSTLRNVYVRKIQHTLTVLYLFYSSFQVIHLNFNCVTRSYISFKHI